MIEFSQLKDLAAKGLPVRTHSGGVLPGEVFLALPPTGPVADASGVRHIPEALQRGAAYIVATDLPVSAKALLAEKKAHFIRHPHPRLALGELAGAFFKTERLPFPVVGITGTNGKTTITYILEHLFRENGRKVGVIGTINYRWPGLTVDAPLTTPGCWQLHELLANMARAGVDIAFMEVSSHALDQDRTAGLTFGAALLTNLTQDHLDYHRDMDAYFRAKAKLFREVPARDKIGVINWDDEHGRILLRNHSPAIGFGLNGPNPAADLGAAGLEGTIIESGVKGLKLLMSFEGQLWDLSSPLVGQHNASNLLAAQALGLAMGCKPKHFNKLSTFTGAPGRLERVPCSRDLNIFVDYAHTPDALENVLQSLRALDFDRVITVFGCGGNRDRGKRPLMGAAVARLSDIAVLTSDNPRHEDPEAIMDDVAPGLAKCPKVIREPDRRRAIALAIDEMRSNDVLLVAGKGHEAYQQIGDVKIPFSDQAVIRELAG